jgi:hypothetical protein
MMRGVGDLIALVQNLLPPWAIALLAVVLVVVIGPAWFDNVRAKQVRGQIRQLLRAQEADKAGYADAALALAGDRPRRLVALVREAHKYLLFDLRDIALRRLRATGRAPDDVAALEKLVAPEDKAAPSTLEAVVRIEQLLEAGLTVGAEEQLTAALRRYPRDPDLLALRARLETAGALAVPDGSSV